MCVIDDILCVCASLSSSLSLYIQYMYVYVFSLLQVSNECSIVLGVNHPSLFKF